MRSYEVGQAQAGTALLLAQKWYSHFGVPLTWGGVRGGPHYHVIPIAISIEQQEQRMGLILITVAGKSGFCLLTYLLFLLVRFVVYSPGKEEIVPVDVGLDGINAVVDLHGYEGWGFSVGIPRLHRERQE